MSGARRGRLIAVAIATLIGVATVAPPAGAPAPEGVVIQPDAMITKVDGTGVVGNNIYNRSGLNQTKVRGMVPGSTVNFIFRMQNDSDDVRFLTPQGCSGNTFFKVRYFLPQTAPNPDIEVTDSITAGALSVGRNPGQSERYRISIKAKATAPEGAQFNCRLKVTINRKGPDDPRDVALLQIRT
jgi:hypothetical protein